jgi:hypothetical protein
MTIKMFEIHIACVTNDTAKTSIKNLIYHYITPCETVIICDSDGIAYWHIACTDRSNSNVFNQFLAHLKKN